MARQLVFTGPKRAVVEEVDLPAPGPGQVLIATTCTLISTGTEMTAYIGEFPPNSRWADYIKYPWMPGYSNVGTVAAIGPEVEGFSIGQRVVSHGAHASQVIQSVSQVAPIPDGVPDEEAAFCTLGVIALNGVRQSHLQIGESVIIAGAGPLGQLATQLALRSGGWPVASLDLAESRLAMAAKHGATHTLRGDSPTLVEDVRATTGGRLADVVFEVTGNPRLIPTLFRLVRQQGRVILLGSPRGETTVDFHDEVHTLGLHVIGAHNRTHTPVETPYNVFTFQRDRDLFLDFLAAGVVQVADMITHRFSWQESPAAFKLLLESRTETMGVVIDWSGA